MSDDPFLLPPRSVVSFSGGRTSGYMLWRILQAFGGALPDDRKIIFENTGKELEETLEFVERCSQRWGVPLIWLEYRTGGLFEEVDFATANRKGEPFRALIMDRNYLPNPVARFCTVELKMLTLNRFIRETVGWEKYTNVVGLRADEGKRVRRAQSNTFTEVQGSLFGRGKSKKAKSGRPMGESVVFPLFDAGITLENVMEFWAGQSFDLELTQDEGNCDLCFLKGAAKIISIMRKRPDLAEWWIEMETLIGRPKVEGAGLFRADRPSYGDLLKIAQGKEEGPGWLWADGKQDGSCGEVADCRCTD